MTRKGVSARPGNGAASNRCAIYTRKSSEEGLEQEFNSLDAQRQACEAFILSQKSTGWMALPDMYDDGGISGGTMERPALLRLLADIGAGRIDTVVVYKVDRLTRSLSDFAKIVDAFDARGVSFVSVTQQFNTTTSMGRLTLNMLLSFAQFEREVTGERIRDKIAASKQKGMWMGGLPPLGYDVDDRKLVVNEAEAATVRDIFHRYAAIKSVRALKEDLDDAGIVSKVRSDRFARQTGGKPIARGALYLMLQNPIYRGQIVHRDNCYPGLHDPIIDEAVWDDVQAALAVNRVERITRSQASVPSLLAGLVYDGSGERMSPTHANRKGKRYRYYVSQSLIKRGRPTASRAACRAPAEDLEAIVQERICAMLGDESVILDTSGPIDIAECKTLIERAADLARRWPTLLASDKRAMLHVLVDRIDVRPEALDIAVRPSAIADVARSGCNFGQLAASTDSPTTVLSVPARVRRTGMETRLLIQGAVGPGSRTPDRSLLRLIGQARRFHDMVINSHGRTITDLARETGVTPSWFTRVLRLSFLAPDIAKAILQGRQPMTLTAKSLMLQRKLSPDWSKQRVRLGFA